MEAILHIEDSLNPSCARKIAMDLNIKAGRMPRRFWSSFFIRATIFGGRYTKTDDDAC